MPEQKMFSQDDLLALVQLMQKENREAMLDAIREMKKLPAHEQEALDKKLKREKELRTQRMREAIADQRTKEAREFGCELSGHKKRNIGIDNPAHAISGQVNNDDHYTPTCIRCFKQFPKIKATDQQIKGGVNLLSVNFVTPELLYEWHMKTVPNCEDCKAGNCAVKSKRQLANKTLDPLPKVTPEGKILADAVVQEAVAV